jgi:predicted RNase H-like HicB family nuclease
MRVPLRVVFYREGSDWIAHCLEFDLVGDGATKAKALASLSEAILLQLEFSAQHNAPENLFRPADGRFFRMFALGKDTAAGEIQLKCGSLEVEIDSTETREYSEDEIGAGLIPV